MGPVSTALEADLREWVRRHGVAVWLDLDGHYTGFVDQLAALRAAGELPYAVCAYRGSLLELMMALEPHGAGVERPPLLLHLPGFNEERVRASPALELYEAGVRYRKSLTTLVADAAAGKVRPEHIATFQERGDLTLEAADRWLATHLGEDDSGFAEQLRGLSLTAAVDDLRSGGLLAGRFSRPEDRAAIWEQLVAWTGLPERWRKDVVPAGSAAPTDAAFAATTWALCVEYVNDLKRDPINEQLRGVADLPPGVVRACCELAAHIRQSAPPLYQRAADEAEGWLADEIDGASARDLGRIDTFRFEEARFLQGALEALSEERWSDALEWSRQRLEGGSFWLADNLDRRSAWELVLAAARLGDALVAAGHHLKAASLELAVERYAGPGAAADRAHRHLEQRRAALLTPRLPEFETLRERLDLLREVWRTWADNWARDFNALCRDQGFLPPAHLQQRTLFEEVVRPLTREGDVTALFMVDALRYEMAEELRQALGDPPATSIQLRARLAELPTVTEVGMNALAPVSVSGRLTPAIAKGRFQGFSTGVFRVKDPDTRRRAMHDRVGGSTCPLLKLGEVVSKDAAALKQSVSRAKLVIIHSQEIDDAGENGVGPVVFDNVMQQLRAAWRLLREAGVRRFVFTSDHGFLLLDDTAGNSQPHGRKIDPKRRHVISPVPVDHTGEVRVALEALSYEGATDQLMFPDSTAVFDTGRRTMSFVHGGNSLQERVIPALTVVHRAASGAATLRYQVAASPAEAVAGMHCVEARLELAAQGTLAFSGAKEIELGLRALEAEGVQVELCQVRGEARLEGGAIKAAVDKPFEVFFRLLGASEARVRVEVYHPGAETDVDSAVLDRRFAVTATGPAPEDPPAPPPRAVASRWLDELPAGGVRQVFAHLEIHGAVTEAEAQGMLGGARRLRRFSLHFDTYAAQAPFSVRVESHGGVKRYVKE
jgi:hypothetical protein